jgi:gamma-glutamyltranspeptidase/glutathione hydrolase
MEGGNAVDAAIATAAALAVVEPFMSGLGGGGGFMLIREGASGAIHALDFIGRVPAAADPSVFDDVEQVADDVRSATVPGTLGGWAAALDRFGTLDLASVLVPAISLAERGYPISPFAAQKLSENAGRLTRYPDAARVYLTAGHHALARSSRCRILLGRCASWPEAASTSSTGVKWPIALSRQFGRPAAG